MSCDSIVDAEATDVSETDVAIESILESSGEIVEPDTLTIVGTPTEPQLEINADGSAFLCTTTEIDASTAPPQFNVFDPNAEVIWPGNALQGRSIQFPTPDPIVAPRGGGTIFIDNINGTRVSAITLDEVNAAAVLDGSNEIIRNQPENFPANISFSIRRVRSEQELGIKAEANASFLRSFKAKAGFELSTERDVSSFLVEITQPFYTLSFERPSVARDFFHESATGEDLAPFAGPDNPPTYISSVTYGRKFYLLIEATNDVKEIEASLSASFRFKGFRGSASGDVKHVSELDDLKVTAYALGGDQNEAFNAILAGAGSLDTFIEAIQQGNDITLAKPLSYAVRSVRSSRLVKNEVTYKYSVKNCLPDNSHLPPLASWTDHSEVRTGRDPLGGFEAECRILDPRRVIVGVGGRVANDNLTTLVIDTAPIKEDNTIDRSKIERIRCGSAPDAGLEALLTVGGQEVLTGIAMRVKDSNLTTLRGVARTLDPETGRLGSARTVKAGSAPDSGTEVEFQDDTPDSQLLITGINARVRNDNVVTMLLNIGEMKTQPR